MLAERLPLPGYLRSDGAQMLPADYFRLADEAGGVDRLQSWFRAQWAAEEWAAYLSGQYVCLRSTTPELMRRKNELAELIGAALKEPDTGAPRGAPTHAATCSSVAFARTALILVRRGRVGLAEPSSCSGSGLGLFGVVSRSGALHAQAIPGSHGCNQLDRAVAELVAATLDVVAATRLSRPA